jgi:hypothetical protein
MVWGCEKYETGGQKYRDNMAQGAITMVPDERVAMPGIVTLLLDRSSAR